MAAPFDPLAFNPSKQIGSCNWPPPTAQELATLSPTILKKYKTKYEWMAYAASLNRTTPGFKNDNITKRRWEDLTPNYDMEVARQIGVKHDVSKPIKSRNIETVWYHNKRDMLQILRQVGLVAPLPARTTAPVALVASPAYPHQTDGDHGPTGAEKFYIAEEIAKREASRAYDEEYESSLRRQGYKRVAGGWTEQD